MDTSQKFLLNSFIYKGTRKMLILRGGSKGLRNIQASEMLGGKCTNSGKTSNTGQYPQGKNQLHSLGHNLHFYEQESFALLSAFYNLQSCKIAQRQGKSEIVQRRPDRTPPVIFLALVKVFHRFSQFCSSCLLPTALPSAHNTADPWWIFMKWKAVWWNRRERGRAQSLKKKKKRNDITRDRT